MPLIEIEGRKFEVEEKFFLAPKAERDAAIEEMAATLRPAYSGKILPISRDDKGNVGFDSNAGILGVMKRAAALPGDVATGKTPIHTPTGQYNPDLINRSFDLAGLASPVNPAIRAGDRAIPGALMQGQRPVNLPTARELKTAGAAGFDAARNAGVDISGEAIANLARRIQDDLYEKGVLPEVAPKTHAILGKVTEPPEGGTVAIKDFEVLRRLLGKISGDNQTDIFAGRVARRAMDQFIETVDPQTLVARPAPTAGSVVPAGAERSHLSINDVASTLRDARSNYAAAKKSGELVEGLGRADSAILERAEGRAAATNSGQNIDNAIRQRVASLLERENQIRGYSDAELEALRGVRDGGPVRNAARKVGNVLGGGGGLGQMLTAAAGGATGAAAGGGSPWGAALGAATPVAAGMSAKVLQNALGKRSLSQVDEMVRANSPLYEQMLAAQRAIEAPDLDRNIAILRAILMGGASSTPRPQQQFGALGPII